VTSIVYLVTTPLTYQRLMRGHLAYMRNAGLDVTAVSSPGPELDEAATREGVATEVVAMQREISLVADARSLYQLVRLLRRRRPDVVNAGTPKAGMLGMIAAKIARVPVRIYTLRGLRAETLEGTLGTVMSITERLTSWCATEVIAVSHSLSETYVQRGLAPEGKVKVLGGGSSNGIDPTRFAFAGSDRDRIRSEVGIATSAPVIGFVGRLVQDKGIDELIDAFEQVQKEVPDAQLLLIGSYEDGDPVKDATRTAIAQSDAIHMTGTVPDASRYYSAFDVMALPSLREGFPNAPLEAAAAAVPTVGFDATGTRDAVVDGQTGALVPIGDVAALAEHLASYLLEPAKRIEHGERAAKRVHAEYRSERIWQLLEENYRQALATAGGSASRSQNESPV